MFSASSVFFSVQRFHRESCLSKSLVFSFYGRIKLAKSCKLCLIDKASQKEVLRTGGCLDQRLMEAKQKYEWPSLSLPGRACQSGGRKFAVAARMQVQQSGGREESLAGLCHIMSHSESAFRSLARRGEEFLLLGLVILLMACPQATVISQWPGKQTERRRARTAA